MSSGPTRWTVELPEVSGPGPDVTVRYWASARAVAGCDTESFSGRHVRDVLAAAAAAHTGLGVVLGVSTILLDGECLPRALRGRHP